MYKIENEKFKVMINPHGGNLSSIFDKENKEELLYIPDPRSWSGQDVVIFPFIGAIKDRLYTYKGKKYSERNHGLIRYMDSEIYKANDTNITILFKSSVETHKEYPFDFELYVTYSLDNNKLTVSYKVLNLDKEDLYFNLGAHPAIKASGYECDNSYILKDTYVMFNDSFDTTIYNLNSDGSLIESSSLITIPKKLELSKDYIENLKTFMIDSSKINKVSLYTNSHKFVYNISEFSTLAIWTKPGFGDFICIEPWIGHPDYTNSQRDLFSKKFLNKLEKEKEFVASYSIEISKN